MMEKMKLFQIWLRFKRWMRSLFLAFGKKRPIDWPEKITEVTEILDDALDVRQTRISGTGMVPKQDEQTSKEERQVKKAEKKRRRFLKRLRGD